MDFCAWFEAYLEDRWWTFDPRNNVPRSGRVVHRARPRRSPDVAMVTTYGVPVLGVDDRLGLPDRRALAGQLGNSKLAVASARPYLRLPSMDIIDGRLSADIE